ncbi:MAG TPA: DUF1553 domain-containing protein [Planctomycetaceae bacterium]|jgi:hypothetical protein
MKMQPTRSPHACGFALFAALFAVIITSNVEVLTAEDVAGIAFFEKRIRPVLVEHCYACHSGDAKIKGGLRLDSHEGWSKGGDSGVAIEPGKPDESLLIEAIRSAGDLKMPPNGRLPEKIIADFEQWVKMGAPDPRKIADVKPQSKTIRAAQTGRRHWAYQPPVAHPVPAVRDAIWPRTSIDHFILARLESERLAPGPRASREMLVRRVFFDLAGLPPTPEQVDEFLADTSADAWEKLVDRLLDSPEFGERWGRHWLDVVRFAESLTLRGFVFKQAWRYRDYVIDAFNRDLPYDQFLQEQVAGDLLGSDSIEERGRRLVATTVLVLGNTNLEEQDKQQLEMDLIDEQLDLLGRGFLAQTITCARCHDHKFDPIPTRDYYALAGILKNSKTLDHENVSKWIEVPFPLAPEREAVFQQHEQTLAAVQGRIQDLQGELKRVGGTAIGAASSEIVLAKDLPGIVVDDVAAKRVGEWQHSQHMKPYIGEGYLHDIDGGKGSKTLTFDPVLPATGKYEVRLAYTPGGNRSEEVPVTVFSADGEKTVTVNERQAPPIEGRFISLGEYRFERDGQSFVIVSNMGTKGHVIADAVQFLAVEAGGSQAVASSGSKEKSAHAENEDVKKLRDEIKHLERDLQSRKANGPKRPMVMTLTELAEPHDLYVHIRGSVHNRGPDVPRGFLEVASPKSAPAIPASEGGRRQLAEWIASRDNPLTARVFVNRAWHWLFGAGLVRTTDNFGTTGELPSHPELLDHLAVTFMDDGWSTKRLVRRIVLSQAYQTSDRDDIEGRAADPENRLFRRMNRRRLDAECLRDAMLAISGGLRTERGGRTFPEDLPADYGFVDKSDRRSVYLPVFRNTLPEIFDVFDFADPSLVTGRRTTSTVAPQALFLMNHPFVQTQSRRAAERLLAEMHPGTAERITRAWRLVLGRPPTEAERTTALRFLADASTPGTKSTTDAWTQLIQGLFATLDFRYVH